MVQLLRLGALDRALGVQSLRQEDPFVRELRDHEGEIRVDTIARRRQRQITEPRLVVRTAILRVLWIGTGPQELHRWDHDLVVGRDDLRERRDGTDVEIHGCDSIRGGFEGDVAELLALDPLEGLEEEGQALGREVREARQVDGFLLLVAPSEGCLALKRHTCSLAETGSLLGADEGLVGETLHHGAPDLLPARAEGALEEQGLAAEALAQVDRQRRVLQVVELPGVAHDASNDCRRQVEDKVDITQASQEHQHPTSGDGRQACRAIKGEELVNFRADAPSDREPRNVTEDVQAAGGAPIKTLHGRQQQLPPRNNKSRASRTRRGTHGCPGRSSSTNRVRCSSGPACPECRE
mmetsp:Transcript_170645/g.542101  ORF Transcript_170645/g.542101 Transcript_170645/m.542101 type:complete len:352 (+) Transcript_170645:2604-3659(+)